MPHFNCCKLLAAEFHFNLKSSEHPTPWHLTTGPNIVRRMTHHLIDREREKRRNNSVSEKPPPPVSVTVHHGGRKLTVLSQPPSGGQVIPSHNTNILLQENAYENDTCSAGKVAGIIHQNDSCLMVNITHHSRFTGKLWVHSPKRQLFYWKVMSIIHQKGSCFTWT